MRSESLGDRIRRLRHDRGLSLAKVCGGDFSRAFLNQVEKGHSRPSIRLLRVIAERLQAPVEYLIDGGLPSLDKQIALEQARIALADGDHRQALALLEPVADAGDWPLGADARTARVRALVMAGRQEEAAALAGIVEAEIGSHADGERLRRLREALKGLHLKLSTRAHRERGLELMEVGEMEAALEHFEAARAILESAPRKRSDLPG